MNEVWWLSVFFLIQGEWIPGSAVSGWSPRPFDSQQECLDRQHFAERECAAYPLAHDTVWICNKGEPLTTLPEGAEPALGC